MAVARLRAVLGLDPKEFQAGIKGASASTSSLQSQITKVGSAIGIAFSAAAVINMARQFATWAADISVVSQNLGILTSETIALNRVAGDTNVSINDMQSLIGMMRGRIEDATDPMHKARQEIEGLGVNFEKLIRLSPVEQFEMLAKAAVDSERGVRAVAEAFGVQQRQAIRLLGVIRTVARDGLPEVGETAGRAADRVDNAIDRMRRGWDRLKVGVLGNLGELDAAVEKAPFWKKVARLTPWGIAATLISPPKSEPTADPRQEQIDRERDALVTATKDGETEAEKIRRQADEKKADAVADQINKERRARLEGLDKMAADHEAWLAETNAQMEVADERHAAALQRLIDHRSKVYREDVEEFKKAERDKAQAQMDALIRPMEAQLERLREQAESIAVTTRGTGTGGDSMSRVGGMLGGERPGMAVLDKQLQVSRLIERNTQQQLEIMRRQDQIRNADGLGSDV